MGWYRSPSSNLPQDLDNTQWIVDLCYCHSERKAHTPAHRPEGLPRHVIGSDDKAALW
jgi:hypothetical protein